MTFRTPLAVALAASVAVALGSCSSGDGDGAPRRAATTTSAPAEPTLSWTVGPVDAQGTSAPGDDVLAAVKATLDAYLSQAVVAPLRSGQPVGDLSSVLSAAALERFAGDPAARATLADEGMPPASTVTAERATAGLRSVAGPDGVTAVVAAQLDLALRAVGPGLDVDIVRQGELTLIAENGGWRIDSFQLSAKRDSR